VVPAAAQERPRVRSGLEDALDDCGDDGAVVAAACQGVRGEEWWTCAR
jgi:hypothetical protein